MNMVSTYLRDAAAWLYHGDKASALLSLQSALVYVRYTYKGATRNRACGAHIVSAIVALGGKV